MCCSLGTGGVSVGVTTVLTCPLDAPNGEQVPLWCLVTFGSYSLANIGYALLTFGDCPEARLSLLQEISEAKKDLKSKGI
jgi:hypothetical protein